MRLARARARARARVRVREKVIKLIVIYTFPDEDLQVMEPQLWYAIVRGGGVLRS